MPSDENYSNGDYDDVVDSEHERTMSSRMKETGMGVVCGVPY